MRNIPQRMKEASDGGGSKKTQCCSKAGLKRGPWTPEEDALLANYVKREGEGRWRMLPKKAGLLRCGKSCRLRWMNYLRPSVKRGHIAPDEEDLILRLHRLLGNRWSLIAGRIPGRTDNEIKNYWNTHLSKKLISQGIDPTTHKPLQDNHTAPPNPNPNSRSADGQHPTSPFCNNFMPANFPYRPISSTPLHATETLHHQHMHGHDGPSSGEMMMTTIGGHDQKIDELNGHEDAGEDVNFFPDNDVFSSFLNSLINEDAYIHNHVIAPFDPLSSAEDKETGNHCMDDFVCLSDQPG